MSLVSQEDKEGGAVSSSDAQNCQYRETLSSVVLRFFACRESIQNRGHNRKKEGYCHLSEYLRGLSDNLPRC